MRPSYLPRAWPAWTARRADVQAALNASELDNAVPPRTDDSYPKQAAPKGNGPGYWIAGTLLAIALFAASFLVTEREPETRVADAAQTK